MKPFTYYIDLLSLYCFKLNNLLYYYLELTSSFNHMGFIYKITEAINNKIKSSGGVLWKRAE